MGVVVLGSINMDLVARADRLPAPGETVLGTAFTTEPGGKGANQAVAAVRLGAPVTMIGVVGRDVYGAQLIERLGADGIDVSGVAFAPSAPTGIAVISVDTGGTNSIVVVPGANGEVGGKAVDRLDDVVQRGDVVLLQLEVPMPTITAATRRVGGRATVVVTPAPAQPLPPRLLAEVGWLVPNRLEAALLVGGALDDDDAVVAAAARLVRSGPRHVVVTLGERGCVHAARDGAMRWHPAVEVEPVDTVAAGDAFTGGLAVALHEGANPDEAVAFALAAGALAVTRLGAQAAMPTRADLDALRASGASVNARPAGGGPSA